MRALKQAIRPIRPRLTPFLQLNAWPHLIRNFPRFARDARAFRAHEPFRWRDLYPCMLEWNSYAGDASGHYFHQDLWMARQIFATGAKSHVDIGSRVDGFVAHVASFASVTYVDVRPLPQVPGISSQVGTITALPYPDHSIESLSCLHVIEHIGLGRYGDPIDHRGHERALAELRRVVAPGGHLYLSAPLGIPRTYFNSHRVFSPAWFRAAVAGFEIVAMAAVNDRGELVSPANIDDFAGSTYACALLHVRRPN